MAYFYTCVGCRTKDKGCEHLESLKKAIRLMGITSLKHICKARVPPFEPGEQVLVEVHMYDADLGDPYGRHEGVFGRFRGVFVQQKGTKGICFIKPGTIHEDATYIDSADAEDKFAPKDGGSGYVKVRLLRIEKIEGAERLNIEQCGHCGQPAHITGCGHEQNPYEPDYRNCLLKRDAGERK